MRWSASLRAASTSHRHADQSGASLPELLVAGSLSLVALGMVAGTVIAPLQSLSRVAEIDEVQARLEDAATVVVVIVRSARPNLDGPPVVFAGDDHLSLRSEEAGAETITTLTLAGGRLTLTSSAEDGHTFASESGGVLIDGLDAAHSVLRVRTASGGKVISGLEADAVVVDVVLHSEGREVARSVRLRQMRP